MNNDSTLVTLNGKLGHLEGVTNVSAQAQAIRQFLENDKAAMMKSTPFLRHALCLSVLSALAVSVPVFGNESSAQDALPSLTIDLRTLPYLAYRQAVTWQHTN